MILDYSLKALHDDREANQMNSVGPGSSLMPGLGSPPHPYPSLGQITSPYEQQQPGKELNKYTSLKAVAEKVNDNFYTNRRHMVEMAAKGSLPMHPMHRMEQEPSNPYSPPLQPSLKQNGHKSKSTKGHSSHSSSSHTLAYGSNTLANPGMQMNWDGTETVGRRQSHGTKKHCTIEQVNEMHSTSRSQHYMPPQAYFVSNSKTEVTTTLGQCAPPIWSHRSRRLQQSFLMIIDAPRGNEFKQVQCNTGNGWRTRGLP
ncbi:hypothetical protein J4Q44_G00173420 [Coregonus suidteri]|uniref:Uncharacterized protein n=1 Tax=Coregonus suidteri TaxID=861788 RepID=A0AAN8LIX5_9TELE